LGVPVRGHFAIGLVILPMPARVVPSVEVPDGRAHGMKYVEAASERARGEAAFLPEKIKIGIVGNALDEFARREDEVARKIGAGERWDRVVTDEGTGAEVGDTVIVEVGKV